MRIENIVLNEKRGSYMTAYLLDEVEEYLNIQARHAVLVIPGGAYMLVSGREAEPVALAYAAEGYNTFLLHYDVRPEMKWPEPLEDAKAAIHYMRQNHEELGIDPNKIVTAGFSAGAHLSIAVGAMGGDDRPDAVIVGYPVVRELPDFGAGIRVPAVIDAVGTGMPPVFLFATFTDETIPIRNSIDLMDALDKAGVPFESHIFSSGPHGMSLGKSHTCSGIKKYYNPDVGQWFSMSVAWIKRTLGDYNTDLNPDELPPEIARLYRMLSGDELPGDAESYFKSKS